MSGAYLGEYALLVALLGIAALVVAALFDLAGLAIELTERLRRDEP